MNAIKSVSATITRGHIKAHIHYWPTDARKQWLVLEPVWWMQRASIETLLKVESCSESNSARLRDVYAAAADWVRDNGCAVTDNR